MSSALAPHPHASLAPAGEQPGFLDGTRALLGGFGFIVRTPAMWALALVPVAVATVIAVAVGVGAAAAVLPWVASLVGPHPILAVLAKILAGVLLLIVSALVGLSVAQPLSGPALNKIVRRVDTDLGAPPWPATGFWEDMGRALASMAVGYAFGLPLLALLALVSFLVPPAAVITFPLKLVVLALMLAWDVCDYPLSTRGLAVGVRVAMVRRHLRAVLGFGFGLALISLIPCAPLLALPAGVAGAARLMRRIELFEGQREGQRGADRR